MNTEKALKARDLLNEINYLESRKKQIDQSFDYRKNIKIMTCHTETGYDLEIRFDASKNESLVNEIHVEISKILTTRLVNLHKQLELL